MAFASLRPWPVKRGDFLSLIPILWLQMLQDWSSRRPRSSTHPHGTNHLPQCLWRPLSAPQLSSTAPHSTRTSEPSFCPSSAQRRVPVTVPAQAPAAQMGTPSLSSLIHLNTSRLLILLFFEKWLPTSSCNRVRTSHLAEKQRSFPARVEVVLWSGDFPENQFVWFASVSPVLLHQRNISS